MTADVHRIDWPTGNTYVLEADGEYAVIDPGYPRYWRRIESYVVGDRGGSLDQVTLVVVTHNHPDHIGGVDTALQRCPSAVLAAHPQAALQVADPRPPWTPHTIAIAVEILLNVARAGFPLPKMRYDSPVDLGLEDGEALPAPFGQWRALHTPGHAREHLSVYRESSGDLIGGDVFANTSARPCPTGLVSDAGAMAETIERLHGLNIEALYPGHGRPVLSGAHSAIL